MRRTFCIAIIALIASTVNAQGILTDADMPALKDALKKAYTSQQCQIDLPGASEETCGCLRNAMTSNLNIEKLKLCKQPGYDDCVATEFTAAKSNLTDKQINDCKALSKEAASDKQDDSNDSEANSDQ